MIFGSLEQSLFTVNSMIDDVIKFLRFLLIWGMFRCAVKMPNARLSDQARISILSYQKLLSLKTEVHISVKGTFQKI